MFDFNYYNPTRLVLGRGVEKQAGQFCKQYGGTKVLVLYGGGSIKKNGVHASVTGSLEDAGLAWVDFGGVAANAPRKTVEEAIRVCKEQGVDFVLAIGGGSVIDGAKGVAAGAIYEGDFWDFYTGKALAEESLPLGVVLTFPASGSEGNGVSSVYDKEAEAKVDSIREVHHPKFALINPETHYSLPAYQTACGCCDIASHMMERYFTAEPHNDLTDRMLEGGLRSVIYNSRILMEKPDDYDTRAEIAFAGTLAHNGLLECGRGMCFGVHAIEIGLTAVYDHITHGAGIALIYPAWMKYCKKHLPERFVQFAVRVWDVDLAFGQREDIIDECIRRVEAWYTGMGLDLHLANLGVAEDKLRYVAEKVTDGGKHTVGHFKPLDTEDVYQILKLAY